MNWDAELDLACLAARAAGELLGASFSGDAGVRTSCGKDIKTRADFAAEELILARLATTGLPIVAEETAHEGVPPTGPHWLVDPLDGTMNFTRGFPMHAVSIALWNGHTPVLGVIYDLPRAALYRGCVGTAAWRNDTAIHVSATAERGQAILATGFPTGRDYDPEALAAFVGRVQTFKKIRMIGSAALSLALVADGTFDAYFEEDIMRWDVAAGLALVLAAGGQVDVRAGRSPLSVHASATNGAFNF